MLQRLITTGFVPLETDRLDLSFSLNVRLKQRVITWPHICRENADKRCGPYGGFTMNLHLMLLVLLSSACLIGSEASAKAAKKAAAPSAKKAAGASSNTTREKIISREGRSKSGDKSKVDFEDTDISGARKTPMASMLSNTKAKKDYDLVPIRTDWKPEMVQSASSLDAGRSR